LVELLIVTAILGVLIGVIGASIAAGVRVWDQARSFGGTEGEAAFALELIARDLRNCFEFDGVEFEGQADRLVLPGMVAVDEGSVARIGSIEYLRLDRNDALVRRTSVFRSGKQRSEQIGSGVSRIAFEYYTLTEQGGEGQRRSWQREESVSTNLPDRVDIRLVPAEDSGVAELTRTVLLPLGVRK
jgi:hypothetical protein